MEVSPVKHGRLLRETIGISCLWARMRGLPQLKVEKAWALGWAMWNNNLFKWLDGILGCDMSIVGVEKDLVGVCTTTTLLTSDGESFFLFPLGFENESLLYWKVHLEDALEWALGMNHNNSKLTPRCRSKVIESPSSWMWAFRRPRMLRKTLSL